MSYQTAGSPRGQVERAYRYYGEDGAILYRVLDWNPKDLTFRRPNGEGGQ